jgi:hypothetical protein
MPPKPLVDRWLRVAEKRARILVSKGRKALAEHKARESRLLPQGMVGFVGEGPAAPPVEVVGARVTASRFRAAVELGSLGGGLAVLGGFLGLMRWFGRRRSARPAPESSTTHHIETSLPTAPPVPTVPSDSHEAPNPIAVSLIQVGLLVVVLGALWTTLRRHHGGGR